MTYLTTSTPAFTLFELVVLKQDLPNYNLKRGLIGTILEIFDENSLNPAYEVDFIDEEGQTLAMVALTQDQLWPITSAQYEFINTVIQEIREIYAKLDQIYPDDPTLVATETLDRIKRDPSLKQRIIKAREDEVNHAVLIAALLDHPAATIIDFGRSSPLQPGIVGRQRNRKTKKHKIDPL